MDMGLGTINVRSVAPGTVDDTVDCALDPRPRADPEGGNAGSMVAGWPDGSALCGATDQRSRAVAQSSRRQWVGIESEMIDPVLPTSHIQNYKKKSRSVPVLAHSRLFIQRALHTLL